MSGERTRRIERVGEEASVMSNRFPCLLVPTLRVGTHVWTLCVPNPGRAGLVAPAWGRDAERPSLRSHAERGNEGIVPLPSISRTGRHRLQVRALRLIRLR